jgi:hypothetical protein
MKNHVMSVTFKEEGMLRHTDVMVLPKYYFCNVYFRFENINPFETSKLCRYSLAENKHMAETNIKLIIQYLLVAIQ